MPGWWNNAVPRPSWGPKEPWIWKQQTEPLCYHLTGDWGTVGAFTKAIWTVMACCWYGWERMEARLSLSSEVTGRNFFLPSHATGLWCIHLVLSWIHCMCQVVCWYVNKTHLDLLPALSQICGIALNMFLYLLEVHKMFSATALRRI